MNDEEPLSVEFERPDWTADEMTKGSPFTFAHRHPVPVPEEKAPIRIVWIGLAFISVVAGIAYSASLLLGLT